MIPLGLTASELKSLKALLVSHHKIAIGIQLLTLSHQAIDDLSDMLLGGQVTVDADATEATRSLTLEVLDPRQRLRLDSEGATDGSIYYTRMIRVIYTVISVDKDERYHIPIFCGPISKVSRNGPVLSIDALGKEKLSMASVWKAQKYKKGASKRATLIDILTDIGGESPSKMDVPRLKGDPRLGTALSVNRETNAWAAFKKLAASMTLHAFYDGRGVARARKLSDKTVWVFRERVDLQTLPQPTFDAESVANAVDIVGGKPKGAKKKVHFRIVAPSSDPLSPVLMGRFGKPRYIPIYVQDDTVKSKKEAEALGKRLLRNAQLESVEVVFDSLPIPFLEENDTCRVESALFSGSFRLKKFTIPLTADGVMSVGYLKKVTPNKRQIKLKNTAKKRRKR